MKLTLRPLLRATVNRLIYDLHLKYKLIIAFSVIMFIPLLLLGITSTGIMLNTLQDMERKALLQSMRQLNTSVDYFFNSYYNASTYLLNNIELQTALNQNTVDLRDAIEGRRKVSKIVTQIQTGLALSESSTTASTQSGAIVRFYITNEPFASFLGDVLPLADIANEPWFPAVYSPYTMPAWQSRVVLSGQTYVVLNRKIIDYAALTDQGVMRVFIPVVKLKAFIDNNLPAGTYYYYYVDDQYVEIVNTGIGAPDKILSTIKDQKLISGLNTLNLDNKSYIIGLINSSVTGWRLIYVAPTNVITATTRSVATATLVSAIVALTLCIFISILVSGFLTNRLDVLVKKTNQVDQGNFAIQERIKGMDEIGQLDMNFNRMVTRVDNLIQNEYRSKLAINKVRLELLQAQINPHLLYNTLSMISMISKEDGRREVLDVTNSLIGFYKGILSRGKIITSFREEMNMVEMYINLMRTVYKLNIETLVEIEEPIFDCFSIKLLLQPVVENSILHGLRQKGGGQIFISGVVNGSSIEFVIADNGVGMPDEIKHFLNSVLNMQELDKSYGLANVIKRVDLFWGREFGVKVESTPGAGTTVILRIPRLSEAEISQRLESKYLI